MRGTFIFAGQKYCLEIDPVSKLKRRQFLRQVGASAVAASAVSNLAKPALATATGKEKIRIGQIGTGHAHARGVFRSLKSVNDDFEIVGVVENDPERRKALNGEYQGVRLISEEELLNTKGLRAVVVETEVRDLVPTARRCIDAGMHLHLDKPAGESSRAVKELYAEAGRKKLTIQMGYIYRYRSEFQFCYKAVRDGWLGDIFEVHAVMSKKVGLDVRKKLAEYRGGSMFEIGCHVIDAMIYVLGKPEKITPFTRQTHPEMDTLRDNQVAVFEYPKATATVRSSLIEYAGGNRRQFTVCGSRGTFDLRPLGNNPFRLALEQARGEYKTGYQEVSLQAGPRGFVSDFRDLAAIIRGEKESDWTPEHDLAVHDATLLASGYDLDG